MRSQKQKVNRIVRQLEHKDLTEAGVPRRLNGSRLGLRKRKQLAEKLKASRM